MENDPREIKNRTAWPSDSDESVLGPINKRQFIMLVAGGMAIFIAQKLSSFKITSVVIAMVIVIIIRLWNDSPNKSA